MEFSVVIVDDDEICLLLHKWIIETTMFHDSPEVFNTGQSALDFLAASAYQKKPVLIFLDINMPEMDGWDLLKLIQQDIPGKEIYVVLVTSSVDQADKDKAKSFSTVIGFAEKPFNRTALERITRSLPWFEPD